MDAKIKIQQLTVNMHLDSVPDVSAQVQDYITEIHDIVDKTQKMKCSDNGRMMVLVETRRGQGPYPRRAGPRKSEPGSLFLPLYSS